MLEELCENGDIGGQVGHTLMKLRDEILPIFHFHKILNEELKAGAKIYLDSLFSITKMEKNIADVFTKRKEKFLMYAPFLDMMINTQTAIDLMILNDSGRKEMEKVNQFLYFQMNKKKNQNLPTSLNSLFARPMQHVLRFAAFPHIK